MPVAQKTGLDHDSRDPQFDLPPVRQDFDLRRKDRWSLGNIWPHGPCTVGAIPRPTLKPTLVLCECACAPPNAPFAPDCLFSITPARRRLIVGHQAIAPSIAVNSFGNSCQPSWQPIAMYCECNRVI